MNGETIGDFRFGEVSLERTEHDLQVTCTLHNTNKTGSEKVGISVRVPAGDHTLSQVQSLAIARAIALLQAHQDLRADASDKDGIFELLTNP